MVSLIGEGIVVP